ncbi:late transcriptional activator [Burkholderia phage Mica]|uniref:Uncharacterized protein n=1 Tax=Burkholderia phage Mica TaxID=2767579 RepID=A0A873WBN3_9CAUD|nr:late transcriptional activator [Burkholderia phage Mica]QPB08677.1 hypothetical protein CPT_Mica_065 [Burkholderia phage Mica]
MIGRERALYLVGRLPRYVGGVEGKQSSRVILYVPTLKRMPADHQLVRILGWKDAEKLAKAFGGEILKPANCNEIYREYRDAAIASMLRAGMTTANIAAIVGVTDRHVRNLRMEIPREEIPTAVNDNAPIRNQGRVNGPANGANAVSRGEVDGGTGRHRNFKLG